MVNVIITLQYLNIRKYSLNKALLQTQGSPAMGPPFSLSISKTDHSRLSKEVPLNLTANAEVGNSLGKNTKKPLPHCVVQTCMHVTEVRTLLGRYAVSPGKQLPTFRST